MLTSPPGCSLSKSSQGTVRWERQKSNPGMAFPVPGASILLLNRHTGKQSRCGRKMVANEQGRGKHDSRKRRPQLGQQIERKQSQCHTCFW